MASKPHLVLLGHVDEQVTSRPQQLGLACTVSKIGGTPVRTLPLLRLAFILFIFCLFLVNTSIDAASLCLEFASCIFVLCFTAR